MGRSTLVTTQFKLFSLLIALASLSIYVPSSRAADSDVLADWFNRTTGPLPTGWSRTDLSNYCNWPGIICNENGRITLIDAIAPNGWAGTFSPGFRDLTSLSSLSLRKFTDFFGVLEPAVFTLPNITALTLDGSFTIAFPPSLSPRLQIINCRANFSGPIPANIDFNPIDLFGLELADVVCPLPQSFINRHNLHATRPFQCRFTQTRLTIDRNNLVCGQIPLQDFVCALVPLVVEPPTYDAEDMPSNGVPTLYSTFYKNVFIEFGEDHTASFFLTYTRNGQRVIFREEYTQLKFFPLRDRGRFDMVPSLRQIVMTPFHNITRVSDRLLVMNATLYTNNNPRAFDIQWIWEFDVERSNIQVGGIAIKFSVRMTNINYTNIGSLDFGISSVYRVQHSPLNGRLISCTISGCNSSTLQLTTQANLDVGGGATIGVTTAAAEFKFSYGYVGNVDGISLFNSDVFEIRVWNYYGGLGWADLVAPATRLGFESLLPRPTPNQYLNFAALLELKTQFKNFDYDPDVQLRLLLQLDDVPQGGPPVQGDVAFVSNATIGIAVGSSFAGVAVIAVVVALVFYLSKRQSRTAERKKITSALRYANQAPPTRATEAVSPPPSPPKWQAATPGPNSQVTI